MKSDLIPEAKYLDPRPREEAKLAPYTDSVNIPLTELRDCMSELPNRKTAIRVVGPDDLAAKTVAWLREHGRKAVQVVHFEQAKSAQRARLWSPNDFLWTYLTTRRVTGTPAGSALDLGCGGGRDTVYLAADGWRVTAVDRLPDSVSRGRELASHYLDQREQERIDWQAADVLEASFNPRAQYDLVTSFFFFDRSLIHRACDWLNPGGVLLMEAFTTVRQVKHGKPSSPDRVVRPGEMKDLLEGMRIVRLEEGEQAHGHIVRVWAVRD